MKSHLILAICSFLLAGSVAAQMSDIDIAKAVATGRRALELEGEVVSRALEACSATRVVFAYPTFDPSTRTEGTKEAVLSVEWSGDCAASKRDGLGVLSWSVERDPGQKVRSVNAWRSEGRFVNG